ncbi:endonuclease/exonuclease/phosphatase family protein [Streptomyces anulatus]
MTSPDYLLTTTEENVPPVKSRLLRVGSYNVMDGGGDRWPAQVQVLAAQNLDILGIQEAKHWDRSGLARVYQTAEALGMQALFAPSQHHGCHLVLMYRWPGVKCLAFDPDISAGVFHHAASRAEFAVDGVDEPLCVVHTHLNPFSPSARLTEANWLTEYAEGTRLALIITDLNSGGLTGTGADQEPADWGHVPVHLHSRHRLTLPDGTYGGSDRRAMSALARAGFVDPPQQLGIAPPRTAGHWGQGSEPWDRRSDYVLASPRLAPALRSHTVLDTPQTRLLSDHLPVIDLFDVAGHG